MVSRSNSSRLIALLAWLVAAPAFLVAQTPAPTTPLRLSFADAVRLASGEVPAVALATLRTSEAEARVRQARSALLPSLSLGGAWVNRDFNSKALGIPFPPEFNLPNPVPPFNNYDGRVTVTQTLFDWSSVARVRAAGAQADGSRAERGVTVEGAASTAALAYLRAARGQAAVAARQADSALAAELVGLAQAQKAAGVSGAIDVTRARTQLVTAEGLLIVARNQMDRARIDVTRALGLDPATPLTLTDSLAPTLGAAEVPAERDAAVTAALAGRPDLGAELARGVAARRSGTAIRAERLPRVGVEADYGVTASAAKRGRPSRTRWCASRRCARATCDGRSPPRWTPRCSICGRRRRSRRSRPSSYGSPKTSSPNRASASRPAWPETSKSSMPRRT